MWGNTGTTPEDLESGAVYAAGLVIRDLPLLHSNWRATESLASFLIRCKVVAIAEIDTRKLTRLLREKGAQSGCIMTGDTIDETAAVRAAKKFPGLKAWTSPRRSPPRRSTSGTMACCGRPRPSRRGRRAGCMWWPTISGSSATSCAFSPSMAAA